PILRLLFAQRKIKNRFLGSERSCKVCRWLFMYINLKIKKILIARTSSIFYCKNKITVFVSRICFPRIKVKFVEMLIFENPKNAEVQAEKEKFQKDQVNNQRMSIEPIIREQLFRDSVDILARVVNEYESIEGKGIIGVIYRATCKFFGFGDFEKLENFKVEAKLKLIEYSAKVATQEVEQKELLGRKTTTFNNREDTDDFLTTELTGESYERRMTHSE
ncbi:unnamed protein product, partial [Oikopleura dioica]